MQIKDILQAWRNILVGKRPSLSIEITRECPLRCPGCYAYEDHHLGGETTLRQLNDFKGDELVRGVMDLVDRFQPLHLSLVGGDPLVRYRELDIMLPQLLDRGMHVQLVTSAFRVLNPIWATYPRLNITVSIDGLEEDHNVRRAPATYERILKNIVGQHITVHCTITGQQMKKPGYLEEFTRFWSSQNDVKRIWFSIFTPQRGADLPEILTRAERGRVVTELIDLRKRFPKIDMREGMIQEFAKPPNSPDECVFAQTTHTYSADLRTKISPCQFGGDPDCSQCGCIASMGLAAVGNYRLGGLIPLHRIMKASSRIGDLLAPAPPKAAPEFRIIQ